MSTLAQNVDRFFQKLDLQIDHEFSVSLNNFEDFSSYLDPRHVVLLHFFHFLFDGSVMFVLETKRLHMIHVAIAVEEVTLQRCPRSFLSVTSGASLIFVVTITVVPNGQSRTMTDKYGGLIHEKNE